MAEIFILPDKQAIADAAKPRPKRRRRLTADQKTGLRAAALVRKNAGRIAATLSEEKLPPDVCRLVIAARRVAFEDQSPVALKKLDEASEAFADRVPWEDEPQNPSA